MWKEYVATKEEIVSYLKKKDWVIKSKGKSKRNNIWYINSACSFDIETTNVVINDIPYGTMYIWMFAVDELFYYARTWEDWVRFTEYLSEELALDESHRIVIYVHNLAFEFQFIRKWFKWTDVFALAKHKPVKAVTNTGIEFRCSYLLSGLGLKKTAEGMTKHTIRKLVGDLDYSLIRGRYTKMTDKEMEYCLNDVLIITAYIEEKMESDGDITKIPMTSTGYVRNYCRKKCLQLEDNPRKRNKGYQRIISNLTLDLDTYQRLNRAFAGGFTHANVNHVDKILENVFSKDFTSSYPAVMIYEYYPMSNFINIETRGISKSKLDFYLKNYCCLLEIELQDVYCKQYESIISKSKCRGLDDLSSLINNGRVVTAENLNVECTELDFDMYKKFYSIGRIKIKNLKIAKRGYLPKEIIQAILELYKDKTELKGVADKVEEYLVAKGMLNSTYGMAVMKVVKELFSYDNEGGWVIKHLIQKESLEEEEEEDEDNEVNLTYEEQQINQYNKSKSRFLYFAWGVWITAHARHNLFTGIIALQNDYVYSDTDSLKYIHPELHEKYFEEYNKQVLVKLEKALDYHELSYDLIYPKTVKGETKPLGVWDDDGTYELFKVLGAKRYLVAARNKKGKLELHMTVAGCSKGAGEYLEDTYGIEGAFKEFKTELVIPKEHSGRAVHTYSDDSIPEYVGEFIDYQGHLTPFREKSFIYLKDVEFTMNRSQEFRDFINGYIQVQDE